MVECVTREQVSFTCLADSFDDDEGDEDDEDDADDYHTDENFCVSKSIC